MGAVLAQVQADPFDVHIRINEDMPGVRRIHSSPDIFLVDDLLSPAECDDIIQAATNKGDMTLSPVAYGGWTEDWGLFARLLPIGALPTVNSMLNDGRPTYEVTTWQKFEAVPRRARI